MKCDICFNFLIFCTEFHQDVIYTLKEYLAEEERPKKEEEEEGEKQEEENQIKN